MQPKLFVKGFSWTIQKKLLGSVSMTSGPALDLASKRLLLFAVSHGTRLEISFEELCRVDLCYRALRAQEIGRAHV